MIERHGPELRRAHLLLRPFYYAQKTDTTVALDAASEMLQQRRLAKALKYAGGAVLCMTTRDSYEQAKRVASRMTQKDILAIGGESVVTLHPEELEHTNNVPRVKKYATRVQPSRVVETQHELRRRYDIGKNVMGDTLVDTSFGMGLNDRSGRPETLIMNQQFVGKPAHLGVAPEEDDAINHVRERAEKLLVDHGLVADINDANGNIRMHPDGRATLVDVSLGSVDDRRQLLVPAFPPQTELQVARIQSTVVPNMARVRYNEQNE